MAVGNGIDEGRAAFCGYGLYVGLCHIVRRRMSIAELSGL